MDVSGKTIIVTGAAAGFGLGLTRRLIDEGATVIAADMHEAALEKLAGEHKDTIIPCVLDVSDPNAVETCFAGIFESASPIHGLVNNAGIMKNAPLVNLMNRESPAHDLDLWQKVIDVNLNGPFYTSRLFATYLLRKRIRGVIVNITSIAAKGNAGQTAYSASKAGLEAMTKVWAKELGPLGIRCAAVAPGFADTQGTGDAVEESRLQTWVEQVPLRRLGSIEEVVDAVCFIFRNDFMNGKTIEIDGGLTI